jgi:hypothetical protein
VSENKDSWTSIRIPKELNDAIKAELGDSGLSATKFVTMSIEDALETAKTGKPSVPRAAQVLRALRGAK